MTEPWRLGVAEAARAIAARRISSAALVESLLARIERVEPELQAWARVDAENALAAARALDAKPAHGPLHGVPVGIKDIFHTAGLEMNAGSPLLAGFVPDEDAPVVRRLREAGAIVLGKCAMTEFAAMDPAPTRNPWNLAHTPGGSSSGSAAAVAACLVPGTLGTQTAGSILRPAAYCGVVGLKPTYDALDRKGIFPCAWSMDHAGPIARSVEDAALLFRVMAGTRPAEASREQLRVGIADRYFDQNLDADTRAAFDSAIRMLESAGAQIVPLTLPPSFEAGVDASIVTIYSEMAAVHRDRFAAHRDRYGWKITCLLDAGGEVSAADYLRAQQIRRLAADELSALLETVDCLATPSTPVPAPEGLDATGDWTCNVPFSGSGHPALSVPVALSGKGLPIGVQLVARAGGEELLFRCGGSLESHARFPGNRRWQ
jgi:aspartyl-tRNA(Asn)/glutamyl-tRNA(Gln) amidotransferase subunit A